MLHKNEISIKNFSNIEQILLKNSQFINFYYNFVNCNPVVTKIFSSIVLKDKFNCRKKRFFPFVYNNIFFKKI
jgi:hypothetical protein